MTNARPTVASLTKRRSTSSWWLFSAFAIAACSTFLTSRAMRRCENVSSANAEEAVLPRIAFATRFSLRGLVRRPRIDAAASFSSSRRSAAGLPISAPSGLFVPGMAVESPGRRELAELMADHVLGHQHRNELVAVVDPEGEPDKLRKDRRPARPSPDYLVTARPARLLRLFEEITVDKRSLPYRACQELPPSRLTAMAAAHNEPIRRLVVPSLFALGGLAPGGDRMAAAGRAAFAATVWMIDRVHRHPAH